MGSGACQASGCLLCMSRQVLHRNELDVVEPDVAHVVEVANAFGRLPKCRRNCDLRIVERVVEFVFDGACSSFSIWNRYRRELVQPIVIWMSM